MPLIVNPRYRRLERRTERLKAILDGYAQHNLRPDDRDIEKWARSNAKLITMRKFSRRLFPKVEDYKVPSAPMPTYRSNVGIPVKPVTLEEAKSVVEKAVAETKTPVAPYKAPGKYDTEPVNAPAKTYHSNTPYKTPYSGKTWQSQS